MDTEGTIAPATAAAARERYEALGSTAQVVVKETAKAMEMDAEEYRDRVTSDVVETARDALFASMLEVRVGSRETFDDWVAENDDYEVREVGSENVDSVVWHAAPAAETVVAATFHQEREAAVGTLRRQAFGRIYREMVVDGDGAGSDESGGATDEAGDE
ncbi:hypothetical protein I7X12_11205 [Halosimplex litoreum]|uniref:Uncharacterized protein n=1 Tax=Halosimplex litoreum TaxID=1198301 RepID=A0A7T3FVB1_9EURY|nr:hypothetical protein I7X12_11205 [Halosimplex litoreum]